MCFSVQWSAYIKIDCTICIGQNSDLGDIIVASSYTSTFNLSNSLACLCLFIEGMVNFVRETCAHAFRLHRCKYTIQLNSLQSYNYVMYRDSIQV